MALRFAEQSSTGRCLDRIERAERVYQLGGRPAVDTSMTAEAEMLSAEVETGFSARVAENQRRVFQIAYSVLGNRPDAEDVTQETFLRAYRSVGSLRDAERFRSWVNRIAFRLALNRQRSSRRSLDRDTTWQAGSAREQASPSGEVQDRLLLAKLRTAIEKLPAKFRLVVQLSVVEEMDASQAGAILGLPAGTVRSRLHTAKKLLLEAMK
jgi:RNA polymerase sigma-70 factor, ECF subfamily